MKTIITFLLTIISICYSKEVRSQNVNWESLKIEQKHILTVNIGWDYGLVYSAGYAYKLKTKTPILIQASQSFPSGKNTLDDFKTKAGAQIRLYTINHIHLSTNINAVFRKFENPLVGFANFGSDISAIAGYYKPKYFVASEFGFDKAIVTHFKHSSAYKNIYPGAQDGWYEPASGGNFYYGIQTGRSFKRSEINLRLGKVLTQDFKTTPLIPYYAQLGYNFKISNKKTEK
jgi:hypothetical protein